MACQDIESRERELRLRVANGPSDPDDYISLAYLSYWTGRFEDSVRILRDALRPALPELARAVLLDSLGWYILATDGGTAEPLSLAEQSLFLTLGRDPIEALVGRADANSLLAHCFWESDRERARDYAALAASLYEQLMSREPPPERHMLYGLPYSAACLEALLGHSDDATRLFETAMEEGNDVERLACRLDLGACYRAAGRLSDAREQLARILKSTDVPRWLLLNACFELGSLEKELGMLAEARAKFQRAIEIVEGYPAFRACERIFLGSLDCVAEISEKLGDFAGAAVVSGALADHLPVSEPYHWYCLMREARCNFELGRHELALADAEQVAASSVPSEADRESARSWVWSIRHSMAKLRYESKDYSACIPECERLLSTLEAGDERYPTVLLLLGHSYLFLKKGGAAKRCYEETLACENATPAQKACATRYLATIEGKG